MTSLLFKRLTISKFKPWTNIREKGSIGTLKRNLYEMASPHPQTRRLPLSPSDFCVYAESSQNRFRMLVSSISAQEMLNEKLESKALIEVDENSTIYQAIEKMSSAYIGSVLVTSSRSKTREYSSSTIPKIGYKYVGIFTIQDYFQSVLKGCDSNKTKVSDFMSPTMIMIGPQHTLDQCTAVMIGEGIRHLPIRTPLDEDDTDYHVVGMLSAKDIMKSLVAAVEAAPDPEFDQPLANIMCRIGRKSSQECSITEDGSVIDALRVMMRSDIPGLFVHSGINLKGMITERDILAKVELQNRSLEKTKVGDIMTNSTFFLSPDSSLKQALFEMKNRSLQVLPVLTIQGSMIDHTDNAIPPEILVARDVCRYIYHKLLAVK